MSEFKVDKLGWYLMIKEDESDPDGGYYGKVEVIYISEYFVCLTRDSNGRFMVFTKDGDWVENEDGGVTYKLTRFLNPPLEVLEWDEEKKLEF